MTRSVHSTLPIPTAARTRSARLLSVLRRPLEGTAARSVRPPLRPDRPGWTVCRCVPQPAGSHGGELTLGFIMRIAMFSWETLTLPRGGRGSGARDGNWRWRLERRGHEVHVFTPPVMTAAGVSRIDGVWYSLLSPQPESQHRGEVQEMCRSFCLALLSDGGLYSATSTWSTRTTGWHPTRWCGSSKPAADHRAVLTMHFHRIRPLREQFLEWHLKRGFRDHERHGTYCGDRVIAVSGALKGD